MSRRVAERPFRFSTQMSLIELTGWRARDLPDLVRHLKEVPGSVIYFHTHHYLKQHQYLSPEPPNDFAWWANEALQDRLLGEKLAAIDTIRFQTLRALRDKLIEVIEKHLAEEAGHHAAKAGEEFHFMKSRSFVMPTPYEAWTLEQFAEGLRRVSANSLYHHIFEARLRLGKPTNDFAIWLEEGLDEGELARRIAGADPYTQTLEGLRRWLVKRVEYRLAQIAREPAP